MKTAAIKAAGMAAAACINDASRTSAAFNAPRGTAMSASRQRAACPVAHPADGGSAIVPK